MGTIYCIENIINEKKYIGSTIQEINERWKQHIRELKGGYHNNEHLQSSFNEYGLSNFKFYILKENVSDDILRKIEGDYIREFVTLNNKYGYNFREELDNGSYTHSDETRLKISKSKKGKHSTRTNYVVSSEMKKRMSDRFSGDRNPNYGKPMSEDRKKKIGDAQRGEKNHAWGNFGELNSFYGKEHSDDTKKIMSELKCIYRYIVKNTNNDSYAVKSMSQFCKDFNLHKSNMCRVANGKAKQHMGWTVNYMTDDDKNRYECSLTDLYWIKI